MTTLRARINYRIVKTEELGNGATAIYMVKPAGRNIFGVTRYADGTISRVMDYNTKI